MTRSTLTLAERARGALLGAAVIGEPGSALLRLLAEELAAGRTDLRRLAEAWVDVWRAGAGAGDPETAAALEYVAAHHAPPSPGAARGSAPLARVVPVALVASRSPRNLVSATFHIAALTHPAPEPAWAAVALNVAIARFLDGRRDFVADVLEVLSGNDAPDPLLAAVRRVPLERREALPPPAAAAADAMAGLELALWLAYHEPLAGRGLVHLAGAGASPVVLGAAAAVLGARDGEDALPADRRPAGEDAARWRVLADRLVPAPSPA